MGSILRLVEGNLAPVPCAAEPCERAAHCPSLPMWQKLDRMINDFFDNITLADLMESDEEKAAQLTGEPFRCEPGGGEK